LRPHPRRRNRRPDPVDTRAAAAPQWQCPARLYPLDQYCFPPDAPSRCNDRRRAVPNGPPLCRPITTSPLIKINAL